MEDVDTIYAVPVELNREGLDLQILRLLHLEGRPQNFAPWLDLVERLHNPQGEVRIAVVGKYVQLEDAYKSLREALLHGGLAHHQKTVLEWIEAEELTSTEQAAERLRGYDGILVPGGFGKRGIQGMVYTIQYAREHRVPFFGICLGMQCATIEYARDVARLPDADSTEFDPQTPHRVIYTKWAAPCGSARGPANSLPAPSPTKPTANSKSANATATAMSSIANTKSS
jgi:CTP synthase